VSGRNVAAGQEREGFGADAWPQIGRGDSGRIGSVRKSGEMSKKCGRLRDSGLYRGATKGRFRGEGSEP